MMKKLIALLLALCTLLSLAACKKPVASNNGTTGSTQATTEESKETTPIREDVNEVAPDVIQPDESIPDSNDEYINPEKFGGKEIQIYGISSLTYDDIENMPVPANYLWMMRAAIDEWATLNNVKVTFEGDYSSSNILGAINSGAKPDLVLYTDQVPSAFNMGISKPFTQEQYDEIAKICGPNYLDLEKYKGEVHAVLPPWTGNTWFYYNKTMFENYGAKTPLEYYKEGNWTWDTMVECWEAVTRDNDGNGKINGTDTFGCSTAIYLQKPYQLIEGDDGKLTSTVATSEQWRKYADIVYAGHKEKLYLAGPDNMRCTTSTTPRPGTHLGDCEWYNFDHLYQTIANGDEIVAIPVPVYSAENPIRWTQYTNRVIMMMKSCDEEEATMALICYMLKVGMRYMADYSCGLFKCTYEGIRGASEFSKGWKEKFAEELEMRRADFAAIEDWDQEVYEKMVQDILSAQSYGMKRYAGMSTESIKHVNSLPSASAIPKVLEAENAWINKYNSLYAG